MTVVIFIIILALLVLSHEFGHFIIAKKSGMRVDEFGFGFPPKIFGKKYGETLYTFNLIPLGGFVKIYGEDGEQEGETNVEKERLFSSRPKYQQALVLIGGVLFNVLLAWILFISGFLYGFPAIITPENVTDARDIRTVITEVAPESPASEAGLSLGDSILSLSALSPRSGDQTQTSVEIQNSKDVSDFITTHEGGEILLTYQRGKDIETVSVIPEAGIIEDVVAIGVSLDTLGIVSLPIHKALWEGTKTTGAVTVLVVTGFYELIAGLFSGSASLDSISGPVGIYNLVDGANGLGISYVIGLTALISISLAVINLLPLPALDGGRLLFLAIEVIRRKPLNQKIVNYFNWAGFALLILLMLIVSFNDLVNLGVF